MNLFLNQLSTVQLGGLLFFLSFSWMLLIFRSKGVAFTVLFFSYLTINNWVSLDVTGDGTFVSILDIFFAIFVLAIVVEILLYEVRFVLPNDPSLIISSLSFMAVMIGFPVLGIILRGYSIGFLTPGIRYFQWFLFFPLTAYLRWTSRLSVHRVLRVFVAIALVHTSYATLQMVEIHLVNFYFLPHHKIFSAEHKPIYNRAMGLFLNPNHFGILMSLIGLVSTASFVSRRSVLDGGIVLISLYGIIISESRAALVVLIGSLLALFPLLQRSVLKSLVRFSPLTIFSVVPILFDPHLVSRFASISLILKGKWGHVHSMAAKLQMWEQSLSIYFAHEPVGTLVAPTILYDLAIDNYYLAVFTQTGFLGLLSLISLYVFIFRYGARQKLSGCQTPFPFSLALVSVAVALGSIVMNLLAYPIVAIFLWTLVGLSMPVRSGSSPSDPS